MRIVVRVGNFLNSMIERFSSLERDRHLLESCSDVADLVSEDYFISINYF